MATIATFRANIRKDLHDEDATAYRWTDAALDRHITRAVNEYSLHAPLEQRTGLTTTPNSRDLGIAGLANLIDVEAVEWPIGEFPPRRVGFSIWQTTLTMDVVGAPSAAESANVYWTRMHTIDVATSTVPASDEDIVCAGGAAYAALDWTSFATNRINTGGEDVWGRYKAFADERLRQFQRELRRVGRSNMVRQRRLYAPDTAPAVEQNRVYW